MQVVQLVENLIIATCYLSIAILVGVGLIRVRANGFNTLGLATFGIFLTCSMGHFVHVLEQVSTLLPNPLSPASDALVWKSTSYFILTEAWYWCTTALRQPTVHAATPLSWFQVIIDGATIFPAITFVTLRRRYGLLAWGEGVIFEYERIAQHHREQAEHLRIYSIDLEQLISKRTATLQREVAERTRAEVALIQVNKELSQNIAMLEQRTHEITILNNLGNLLQSCKTAVEAYTVTARLAHGLLPNLVGVIYTLDKTRTVAEAVAGWGVPLVGSWPSTFNADDCWALRRGQGYMMSNPRDSVLCGHLAPPLPISSLCIPLIVQGKVIGLLHLQRLQEEITATEQMLAEALVERLELTLTNLSLWAVLWDQSVRDPLTQVFNRRYMKESLDRELYQARRNQSSVSVILLDLDHFKQLNDTAGHAAGDAVLAATGVCLEQSVRQDDIVCRYGGEEFMLILPDAPLEIAYQRAERIRESIHSLRISQGSTILGPITASLGVAAFPTHGDTQAQLLHAVDMALYTAKMQGRNRVIMAATQAGFLGYTFEIPSNEKRGASSQ